MALRLAKFVRLSVPCPLRLDTEVQPDVLGFAAAVGAQAEISVRAIGDAWQISTRERALGPL